MAKVYPKSSFMSSSSPPPSSSVSYMTSTRETFTLWMKSLVFHGNGCTVFDSNGEIVYRIDNYDHKCSDKVHLMDLRGKVLFTIQRKKLSVFGCWEGYRCIGSKVEEGKPWFRIKRHFQILKRDNYSPCEAVVGRDENQQNCYNIKGSLGKAAFKIVDQAGGLVAEVKQKRSTSGIALGDDVMTLVVESNVDHSLIMAFVVVYSLINHKL